MIGKLTGRVDHRAGDHVLLDVNGVGYIVYCSDRTLAALPPAGQMAALYTELLVREDLLQLFGFLTLYEREWHRLLISVQGIGAKASMAILGTLGAEGIARAIAIGDWASVKAAPGVGPKIAQRVVNELKDKAPAVMALGGTVHEALGDAPVEVIDTTTPADAPRAPVHSTASAQAEALSALQNLGYAPSEAASAVATAAGDAGEADTPALIRAALRLLAPRE
ncbi:Holliday junction branch migration protein RuvA [Rhodophyticola sp.]|jgi:Holliday junction DNA helicase RuvA|uniref:Holliday junction branch migration protein RuvA n=1 Tax=Rhodophyticola sp. TaxID=2680032 RepID=UPI001B207B73|nr:Holliday junction branch migration protein RuvA [Roseicyclus sp.]MBO6626390.1 Holliday junction branch migration protein RuvA [Roseicyclus sp.]MBO6921532.1 Holliday junction branch migration protein RuvA [Roseicyclus sp.]